MSDDHSESIVEAVRAARAEAAPLYLHGGDTKRGLLGRTTTGRDLDLSAHRGIAAYEPGELVITVRAGTTVAELQAALAAQGQVLAADPPQFAGRATIGGSLASNLSGPARPFAGSLRDAVLGVKLVNGCGKTLNFGGQVIKNVAGYDVARLQAGALGTLGALLEISLKVAPLPEHSLTLTYDFDAPAALETMLTRAREPAPLSGALWTEDRLYLRLSGAAAAVQDYAQRWGGQQADDAQAPWADLREMRLPFFATAQPLWRLSVSPTLPVEADDRLLIDWCGAQRWLQGVDKAGAVALARRGGGHATLFRGGDRDGEVRQDPGAAQRALQARLKAAFDPAGVLNPGRLYSWM